MKGKRVLFPFSFHCTGMPIAAAAKKLLAEYEEGSDEEEKGTAPPAKKQSEILKEMDVPEDDIFEFTQPLKWLQYFPTYA